MDYFISQSQGSDIRTIKNIGSSISEFIAYEPTLDPKELANFIKLKFKEWKPYRMSQMEHARDWNLLTQHLIKFMEVLYQEELTKYTFDLSFMNSNTLTPYKLFLVYDKLLSYNQFQDALIINLLYTLCISIKTLTLLECTNIDLNKIISFYDFSVNDIRKVAIPVDLLNEILYFKRYQSIKNSFLNIKTKNQEIKQKNKRSFIIQINKSMIYKRFKEKFDGEISWFEHTPRDILLLSRKINSKYHHMLKYPIPSLSTKIDLFTNLFLRRLFSKILFIKHHFYSFSTRFPSSSIMPLSYRLLKSSLCSFPR